MKETYLHYVWENRLFQPLNLYTSKKEKIEILSPGIANKENGPDFLNALVTIAGVMWAGNVEIHVKSSDWKKHKHQFDREYNQVILHVVHEHDEEVMTQENKPLQTLELKNLILNTNSTCDKNKFEWNKNIPCAALQKNLKTEIKNEWLKECALKRIQSKAKAFIRNPESIKSKEELLFESIASVICGKANSLPMIEVQKNITHSILYRHRDSIINLLALYLGVAGLIPNSNVIHKNMCDLNKVYKHLQRKYNLAGVKTKWKTGGIRPNNRAEIRIIQYVFIIYCFTNRVVFPLKTFTSYDWMNALLNTKEKLVSDLDRISCLIPIQQLIPGKTTLDTLIINCLIPYQFNESVTILSCQEREQKMEHQLKIMKAEKNFIMNIFEASGFIFTNALESQGALHLYRNFCQAKKCLKCPIGKEIMS